jgi:hypothetical protein
MGVNLRGYLDVRPVHVMATFKCPDSGFLWTVPQVSAPACPNHPTGVLIVMVEILQ